MLWTLGRMWNRRLGGRFECAEMLFAPVWVLIHRPFILLFSARSLLGYFEMIVVSTVLYISERMYRYSTVQRCRLAPMRLMKLCSE